MLAATLYAYAIFVIAKNEQLALVMTNMMPPPQMTSQMLQQMSQVNSSKVDPLLLQHLPR